MGRGERMGAKMTKETLEELHKNGIDRIHATGRGFKMERWMPLEEVQLLHTFVKDFEPELIFESGTANGWSALWLSLYGAPVYTFDPISRLKLWDSIWEDKVSADNITYTEAAFATLPETFPELKGKKNLFFIDGAHTASGVTGDCAAVMEFASPGDTVIFHDLNLKPCVRGFHRMQKYASEFEVYQTRQIIGRLVLRC